MLPPTALRQATRPAVALSPDPPNQVSSLPTRRTRLVAPPVGPRRPAGAEEAPPRRSPLRSPTQPTAARATRLSAARRALRLRCPRRPGATPTAVLPVLVQRVQL